ncbi:ABC transporter ATP-binding protein [Pseudonocardiaceae bacterium YIM PH 21723]|nr:ABC transporter ATP-binding protein [Pseudonocardiaceae bacterium YIM PH 21723]
MSFRGVSFSGVSKRYRGRRRAVLTDVTLHVRSGEVVSLHGANGSGKSTLLRMMAGLSTPSSGVISGRPEIIGYVPDRFPPGERLSATEYLAHMGRIRGLSTAAVRARAAELLDRLALVGGAHVPLRTLSKGNAQKVTLAQALLVPPELLVLDEPWSGLDASAHQVLGEVIAETAATGGAVVFTDHRESIGQTHATTGYALVDGRLSAAAAASVVSVTIEVPAADYDGLLIQARDRGWRVRR